MRKFNVFGLIVFLMVGLSACSTAKSVGLKGIEQAAAQPAEGGLAKKMADQLLGEVSGQDHRAVRMCMIAAVASELVTYRMVKDPGQAMMGFGQIAALDAAVTQFEQADGMWLNTEVAHIVLQMTSIMVDSVKARLPGLLANFAGGVNVMGLVDEAAVVAGQGSLLAAGIHDIKARVAALNSGAADPTSSMLACRARIDFNRDQLAALIGAGQ